MCVYVCVYMYLFMSVLEVVSVNYCNLCQSYISCKNCYYSTTYQDNSRKIGDVEEHNKQSNVEPLDAFDSIVQHTSSSLPSVSSSLL